MATVVAKFRMQWIVRWQKKKTPLRHSLTLQNIPKRTNSQEVKVRANRTASATFVNFSYLLGQTKLKFGAKKCHFPDQHR